MMKEAVTKLANEEIKPYVSKMDKEGKMDPAVLQMLFDNGIMGIEIPECYGRVVKRCSHPKLLYCSSRPFLVADAQLYKRLCPSVRLLVCWSVGPWSSS